MLAAWGVHAFTASGAVVGIAALLAIGSGDLRAAALWMLVALSIDSVDGTLARAVRVSEVLPDIDGRRLDDVVDYLNYAIVPAMFLVAAGSVSHWSVAALPAIASAYGFSQADAKTSDHFFVGFPSYWNVLAIYLWLLEVPYAIGTALVIGFTVLVFVPLKYVYPSRIAVLWYTTNGLAALWIWVLAAAIAFPQRTAGLRLIELSLLYPAFYLGLSFWLGGLHRSQRRRR